MVRWRFSLSFGSLVFMVHRSTGVSCSQPCTRLEIDKRRLTNERAASGPVVALITQYRMAVGLDYDQGE